MWIYDLKAKLRDKFSEEKAQGMVEYAIIIAVIAVISVAVFVGDNGEGGKAFDSVNGLYEQADNAINQIEIQNLGNDAGNNEPDNG
jgi:Flp pilus assembly pilin Flp